MPESIPTKEPESFRAGDTVEWKKSLDSYKASDGWTLSYSFRGISGTIDCTAAADGHDHLISLPPTTTTAYSEGIYDVVGSVTKGTNRHTVYSSRIEVLVDLANAGSSYDGRSHVEKTLRAIEAVIERRATKEVLESSIEGVTVKRYDHAQLLELRAKYARLYDQELAAERLKLGKGSGNRILVRFE